MLLSLGDTPTHREKRAAGKYRISSEGCALAGSEIGGKGGERTWPAEMCTTVRTIRRIHSYGPYTVAWKSETENGFTLTRHNVIVFMRMPIYMRACRPIYTGTHLYTGV